MSAGLLALAVVALAACGDSGPSAREKCEADGGTYEYTHSTTIYVKAGNVMVPISSDHYECRMPR